MHKNRIAHRFGFTKWYQCLARGYVSPGNPGASGEMELSSLVRATTTRPMGPEPLSQTQCMRICLHEIISEDKNPFCLFRQLSIAAVTEHFGLVSWELEERKLELLNTRGKRGTAGQALYNLRHTEEFVWDEYGDAESEAACRQILNRFIEGATVSGSFGKYQWETCKAFHESIWSAANKVWGTRPRHRTNWLDDDNLNAFELELDHQEMIMKDIREFEEEQEERQRKNNLSILRALERKQEEEEKQMEYNSSILRSLETDEEAMSMEENLTRLRALQREEEERQWEYNFAMEREDEVK
ncbi:hypothetical protein CLAIMM_00882 [Cladophialophora immunda]|nr:hypothetical protein CLAIMM_00882 [Cladophialophora immunda]